MHSIKIRFLDMLYTCLTFVLRFSLVTVLKINGLLFTRKGFINNVIVVQYQKYVEVCDAFVKIGKTPSTRKDSDF